jgi:hypothetical protein
MLKNNSLVVAVDDYILRIFKTAKHEFYFVFKLLTIKNSQIIS